MKLFFLRFWDCLEIVLRKKSQNLKISRCNFTRVDWCINFWCFIVKFFSGFFISGFQPNPAGIYNSQIMNYRLKFDFWLHPLIFLYSKISKFLISFNFEKNGIIVLTNNHSSYNHPSRRVNHPKNTLLLNTPFCRMIHPSWRVVHPKKG